MIPLALRPSRLNLGLIGAGAPAVRRLRGLLKAGAQDTLKVFTLDPALAAQAGETAFLRLPTREEIQGLHVLWIAGLEEDIYRPLADMARTSKVLLNVEDVPEFCDFNAVAEVRRGDLLLTISTNGQAPGLAGTIRRRLENCFPESWAHRVKQVAALRQSCREEKLTMAETAQRVDAFVDEQCWLSCPKS